MERDEKRSGCEKVSGCCISSATTRAVDDDVIIIDDLMAETDERVTTLFTKKVAA